MKKVNFKMLSMTESVTSIFSHKKAEPMFNRPIGSGCPHHRLSRILYVACLPLLVLMSLPVIVLKAMTYSFIEDNRDQGFVFMAGPMDGEEGVVSVVMAALPKNLYHAPAKLALVAAVLSIILAAAHLGFVLTDWKTGKRTQSWAYRRNMMFLHVSNAILVLFALVSLIVTHKSSSQFRNSYVNFRASSMNSTDMSVSFFRYKLGTFDLETWACELEDVPGVGMVRDDYGKQCNIEVAGRAVVIPFVTIAWSIAGVAIWALVAGGKRGPNGERIKTVDVGLELGKMNATDAE